MSQTRDINASDFPGRNVIAVIGIDDYQHWDSLANATNDARGARACFSKLGFVQVTEPLFNRDATSRAINELVTDELRSKLLPDDNLVLFYAGHGCTEKSRVGCKEVETGYLIPADASERISTWIRMDTWLTQVAELPARHILVILDACYSGIALGQIVHRIRGKRICSPEQLQVRSAKASRTVITSAGADQVALDTGPMRDHSLFTGCLLEVLTHGEGLKNFRDEAGNRFTTAARLGAFLQDRVWTYKKGNQQRPEFGAFNRELGDDGEMVLPLLVDEPHTVTGATMQPWSSSAGWPVASHEALPGAAAGPGAAPARPSEADATPAPASGRLPAVAPIAPSQRFAGSARPPAAGDLETQVQRTDPRLQTEPPSPRFALRPEVAPAVSQALRAERPRAWMFLAGTAGGALAFGLALFAHGTSDDEEAPPRPADAAPATPAVRPPPPAPRGCPAGMVAVPTGTFLMGSPDGEGEWDEHPQHEVTLSAYCIDRTEVTVAAYAACVKAKGCPEPLRTVNLSDDSGKDGRGQSQWCNGPDRPDHPMNCVDWAQAKAYCRWAKKRLPTEAEWEYAARGRDGRRYPWGNQAPTAERLNGCGPECVAMGTRDLEAEWNALYDAPDDAETTAPVGHYPGGASPFGALDMAGNVWEWTADWHAQYAAEPATDPQRSEPGNAIVVRGGAWYSQEAPHVRVTNRGTQGPTRLLNHLGFRCARN